MFSQVKSNCQDILAAVKAHAIVKICQPFSTCQSSKSLRFAINRRNAEQLGYGLTCYSAEKQASLDVILTDDCFLEVEPATQLSQKLLFNDPFTRKDGSRRSFVTGAEFGICVQLHTRGPLLKYAA